MKLEVFGFLLLLLLVFVFELNGSTVGGGITAVLPGESQSVLDNDNAGGILDPDELDDTEGLLTRCVNVVPMKPEVAGVAGVGVVSTTLLPEPEVVC